MEETELKDRMKKLENRVSFLEAELETSLAEERFRNTINRVFSDNSNKDFDDSQYGFFVRVTNLDGDDVEIARQQLKSRDVGLAITETGEGLGMEVWDESEPRF